MWKISSQSRRIHNLSTAYAALSRIDDNLGHKTNLKKFKRIKITTGIIVQPKEKKKEKKQQKKKKKQTLKKNTNAWGLKNTLLNRQ